MRMQLQAEFPCRDHFMSQVQFEEEEKEGMKDCYYANGAPPLAPILLQRRRKRDEIRARYGRDLREHSCERGGVSKVAAPALLLFFVSAGSQGGTPCPRHLCSEAESVIVGYTHSEGMLCNRLRPAALERRNAYGNTEAGHVLRESCAV